MNTKGWHLSRDQTKTVLAFYESEEISCLLPVKKDCVSIQLPDKTKTKKQKQHLSSNVSEIYVQFKKKNPDRKLAFHCLHSYIQSGASLLLQQVHTRFVFALITKM